MLRAECQKKIIDLTRQKGIVTTEELMTVAQVSISTVRRYIAELDAQGLIKKVRGGARIFDDAQSAAQEPALYIKSLINQKEKQKIAIAAAALIDTGNRVILDSGTTVLELAKVFDKELAAMVITNDARIALELNDQHNADVILIGGMMRKGFCSSHGILAEQMLGNLQADKLFFSVDSISPDLHMASYTLDDVSIKKTCMSKSAERILLCDHSKFSAKSLFMFDSLDAVDTIIVDSGLDSDVLHRLKQLVKRVIVA